MARSEIQPLLRWLCRIQQAMAFAISSDPGGEHFEASEVNCILGYEKLKGLQPVVETLAERRDG